jgi:hypothetical protein
MGVIAFGVVGAKENYVPPLVRTASANSNKGC